MCVLKYLYLSGGEGQAVHDMLQKLYVSETSAQILETQRRSKQAEMQMLRRLCSITRKDGISSESIRKGLGVGRVSDVIRWGRLTWYGYIERKDDKDWVKNCSTVEIAGMKPKGMPKLTRKEVVKNDMMARNVTEDRHLLSTKMSGEG